VDVAVENDVVTARQAGRELARGLGFGAADQTRLATAISEVARNALKYAGKGVCRIYDTSDAGAIGVEVVVEDSGPGIPDVIRAMADGYTTGGSLGYGLPAAKRLVSDFQVESEPGHTQVTMRMRRPRL